MLNQKLKIAIFLSQKKAYEIAHEAGINPSTLSKLIHGIERVKPGDPRVVAVGKVLGFSPSECFQGDNGE